LRRPKKLIKLWRREASSFLDKKNTFRSGDSVPPQFRPTPSRGCKARLQPRGWITEKTKPAGMTMAQAVLSKRPPEKRPGLGIGKNPTLEQAKAEGGDRICSSCPFCRAFRSVKDTSRTGTGKKREGGEQNRWALEGVHLLSS